MTDPTNKTNIQKYVPFTPEAADEAGKELKGDSRFMSLEPGRYVVRVLPARPGQQFPWHVVHEHYVKLPGGNSMSFACPRMLDKKPCPVCERADALAATGNPVDYDKAGEMRPRTRGYMNVIDLGDPEPRVQILAVPKTILNKLRALAKDPVAGGDFTDPHNGYAIVIEREGTGKETTKYDARASRKSGPIADTEEEIDELLDCRYDLRSCVKVRTAKDIVAAMGGDEAIDVTPTRVTTSGPGRPPRNAGDDMGDVDED